MEPVIGFFLFFALCVWILIDMRRLRKKTYDTSRTAPGTPYTVAEVNQARYFALGLACAFYALAVSEWLNPSLPPFTGRGSFLYAMLYYSFGPKAVAVFWALFGTGLGLLAFFKTTGARR